MYMYAQQVESRKAHCFVVRLLKNGDWLYGLFNQRKFLKKTSKTVWDQAVLNGLGPVEKVEIEENTPLLEEAS